LKDWNRDVFGILDLNIEKMMHELNEVEGLLASDGALVDLVRREGIHKEYWQHESMLKQKFRLRWVKESNSNSRFFHATIKNRRRNQLTLVLDFKEF
jgi:hypothetical protein